MSTRIRTPQELGALIKQRRKSLNLTQQDVVGMCGLGNRFLVELEHGKATASLGKTLQVLHMLGLDLEVACRE